VRKLSDEPGLVGRLGSAARTEVAERFSWQSTWGQALLDVMTSIGATPTRSEKS
jgi:hypothetical protein